MLPVLYECISFTESNFNFLPKWFSPSGVPRSYMELYYLMSKVVWCCDGAGGDE